MKNSKLIGFVFAILAISFAAGSITAQEGRYVNTYSKSQVKGYIDKLESSSNTFRRDFDRQMDRSRRDGTIREDEYNRNVREYEDSLDRLRNQFNRGRWWSSRSNVEDMLARAQSVNTMMNAVPFARRLERQWNAMRRDINKVADTYDLPGLNGGGWTGGPWTGGGNNGGIGTGTGGWNGSGQMSAPPTWARGTFGWFETDSRTMTIDSSGRVTLYALGNTTYGTYNRNVININGDNLRVTRVGNGIRLYNPNGGGTSDWQRQ